jgi:hypothetical protein
MEHGLKVFENRVLTRKYRPEGAEVIGIWNN